MKLRKAAKTTKFLLNSSYALSQVFYKGLGIQTGELSLARGPEPLYSGVDLGSWPALATDNELTIPGQNAFCLWPVLHLIFQKTSELPVVIKG